MQLGLSYALLGFEPIPFSLVPSLSFQDQLDILEYHTVSIDRYSPISSLMADNESFKALLQKGEWKPGILDSLTIWRKKNVSVLVCGFEITKLFTNRHSPNLSIILDELFSNNTSYVILHSQKSTYIFSLTSKGSGLLSWSPLIPAIRLILLDILLDDPSILVNFIHNIRWETLRLGKSIVNNILNQAIKTDPIDSQIQLEEIGNQFMKLLFDIIKVQLSLLLYFQDLSSKYGNHEESWREEDVKFLSSEIKEILTKKSLQDLGAGSLQSSFAEILIQSSLSDLIQINPVNFLECTWPSTSKPLAKGQYTPLQIAESLIVEIQSIYSKRDFSPLIDKLRIYDPAMGTGILLIFLLESFTSSILKNHVPSKYPNSFIELRELIYNNCLFGNDIDGVAIECGRAFFNAFCGSFQSKNPSEFHLQHFKRQDFVSQFLEGGHPPDQIEKYDIIISNPPFGAFHSRFTHSIYTRDEIQQLISLIPEFTGRRINLYCIFLGLSLKYLSKPTSGLVGFVVDSVFLDLPSYENLRRHLIENYNIYSILAHFKYVDAVVDIGTILLGQENLESQEKFVKWRETINEEIANISCSYFLSQPHHSLSYIPPNHQLETILSSTITLGNIANVACGLEYGRMLKSHFLSSKPSKDFFPVLDGSHGVPHPFVIFWVPECVNSYVRINKEYEEHLRKTNQDISPNGKKVLLISGSLERFIEPKIILRQTAPEFVSVYDDQGFFALRNLHIIYNVSPPYSLELILGILNSKLGKLIGEHLNILRKKGFHRYPQIRVNGLKRFPMIKLLQQNEQQKSLINKIEDLVKLSIKEGRQLGVHLKSLWFEVRSKPNLMTKEYPNQQRFIKACLSGKMLDFFHSPIPPEIIHLSTNLSRGLVALKRYQTDLDSYIIDLYGMDNLGLPRTSSNNKEVH
jgi:hypothetical protein